MTKDKEYKWLTTMKQKGTLKDKTTALETMIKKEPNHTLTSLDFLISHVSLIVYE